MMRGWSGFAAWINGISDTWLRIFVLAGLVISLIALCVAGVEMLLSRPRYKKLKNNQDRILDYLHRKFDVRLEGHTKFEAMEATVSVGKRRAKKRPLYA